MLSLSQADPFSNVEPSFQKSSSLQLSPEVSPAHWAPLEVASRAGELQNQHSHWEGRGLNNPMVGLEGPNTATRLPEFELNLQSAMAYFD